MRARSYVVCGQSSMGDAIFEHYLRRRDAEQFAQRFMASGKATRAEIYAVATANRFSATIAVRQGDAGVCLVDVLAPGKDAERAKRADKSSWQRALAKGVDAALEFLSDPANQSMGSQN